MTIAYTCAVCGEDQQDGLADAMAVAELLESGGERPLICPTCVDRIAEGVCGATRRTYACLRPEGHEPAKMHASLDGKWAVWWSDDGNGVTLKRRQDVA